MPIVIQCPTCRHSLTVREEQFGRVVMCPACQNRFEAPGASAAVSAHDSLDFASQAASTSELPRYRTPTQRRRSTLLLLAIGAVLVLAAATWFTLATVNKSRQTAETVQAGGDHANDVPVEVNKSRQTAETARCLIALNRANALNTEHRFWLLKLADVDAVQPLRRESEEASALGSKMDAELDARWGKNRRGLGGLNARKGEAFTKLSQGTERLVSTRLEGNVKLMQMELQQFEMDTRARVLAEAKPILMGQIDRSTSAGEREFQEKSRLLPIERDIARAEREEEIVKKVNANRPSLIRRWVQTTRSEIKSGIEELEKAFLAVE